MQANTAACYMVYPLYKLQTLSKYTRMSVSLSTAVYAANRLLGKSHCLLLKLQCPHLEKKKKNNHET